MFLNPVKNIGQIKQMRKPVSFDLCKTVHITWFILCEGARWYCQICLCPWRRLHVSVHVVTLWFSLTLFFSKPSKKRHYAIEAINDHKRMKISLVAPFVKKKNTTKHSKVCAMQWLHFCPVHSIANVNFKFVTLGGLFSKVEERQNKKVLHWGSASNYLLSFDSWAKLRWRRKV